ncbi:hypothetical protein, partial [Thermococcus sp. JCM 11816]|uniref:hypothetical protein n=1 Tax=Thermococcus sp. (strain JCM 11816 / KS-1) TaxID=1295125 RepID=UPI0006D121AB
LGIAENVGNDEDVISILLESYCNKEGGGMSKWVNIISILLESYCNNLLSHDTRTDLSISILLESYCNRAVFSLFCPIDY